MGEVVFDAGAPTCPAYVAEPGQDGGDEVGESVDQSVHATRMVTRASEGAPVRGLGAGQRLVLSTSRGAPAAMSGLCLGACGDAVDARRVAAEPVGAEVERRDERGAGDAVLVERRGARDDAADPDALLVRDQLVDDA